MKQLCITVPDDLAERLKASGNISEAMRQTTLRYQALLLVARADLRQKLDAPEVGLLADLTNGVLFDPYEIALQAFPGQAEDAEESDYRKWGVARAALLSKLRGLSWLERAALIDALERFRQATRTGIPIEAEKILQG